MRPGARTKSPPARVQRHFDCHRLAEDSQVLAYERVLPIVPRSLPATAELPPGDLVSEPIKPINQGGMAA
jgi:hypothetical protein